MRTKDFEPWIYYDIMKFYLEGDFPHRIMETGQKYHGIKGLLRDEFSSPFHWETQSQMETFYVMDRIDIPGESKKFIPKLLPYNYNIQISSKIKQLIFSQSERDFETEN